MISLRHHNALDYAQLPMIDDGQSGIITSSDQAYLDAFGALLVKHQATQRWGASLLHSHFSLNDSEVMIENVDRLSSLVTLFPASINAQRYHATNICFSVSENAFHLIGLEYSRDLGGVTPVCDGDFVLLEAIFALLTRHGMLRRFGIRLITDPLQLDGAFAMLETCNSKERILTSALVEKTSVDFTQSIPTFFTWRVVENDNAVEQGCRTVCNVVQGCMYRPDGGHEGHGSHDRDHESDGRFLENQFH